MRSDCRSSEASGYESLLPTRRRSGLAVDEFVNCDDLTGTQSVSELVPGEARFEELGTREGTMLGTARLA